MSITLISHFYNEAFLLPYWLKHHVPLVDRGVLIDYQSTDDSVAVIEALAPSWEIRPSQNECFDAIQCDREVMAIEQEFEGWKIALNTTEFLFHDDLEQYLERLVQETPEVMAVGIQGVVMVDREADRGQPVSDEPLYLQRFTGYMDTDWKYRCPRWVHRGHDGAYETGRHGTGLTRVLDPTLLLLWHAWSPFDQIKQRKLQIQTRIPESDRRAGFGRHHLVDDEGLEAQFWEQTARAVDLSQIPACEAMRECFRARVQALSDGKS